MFTRLFVSPKRIGLIAGAVTLSFVAYQFDKYSKNNYCWMNKSFHELNELGKYHEAVKSIEKLGKHNIMDSEMFAAGISYLRINDYDTALEYFKSALHNIQNYEMNEQREMEKEKIWKKKIRKFGGKSDIEMEIDYGTINVRNGLKLDVYLNVFGIYFNRKEYEKMLTIYKNNFELFCTDNTERLEEKNVQIFRIVYSGFKKFKRNNKINAKYDGLFSENNDKLIVNKINKQIEFYNLGIQSFYKDNINDAIFYTEKANDIQPTATKPLMALAEYYWQTKQYKKLCQRFERALKLDEGNAFTNGYFGGLLILFEEFDKALPYVQNALTILRDHPTSGQSTDPNLKQNCTLHYAKLLSKMDKINESMDICHKLIQQNENNPKIHYLMSENYLKLSDHQNAQLSLEKAREIENKSN